MPTQDVIQSLNSRRFNMVWRRTSPYLPLSPGQERPRRNWLQRCKRWLWRLTHRKFSRTKL